MQKIWNWLMHTNARALFLVCLLALLAMLGWRGYVEYDAMRYARAAALAIQAPPTLPTFPPYEGMGILAYVEEQVRPDSRALPVDLFRPSLDSMVSNLVHAILTDPSLEVPTEEPATPEGTSEARKPTLKPGEENLFEVVQNAKGEWVRQPRPQPAPQLTYNGVFKRTDERIAAWVTEANSRTTRFYGEGDHLHGATLVRVSTKEIDLLLPDGTVSTLPRGGTLKLPAPATPAADAVPVAQTPAAAPAPAAGRRRTEGVFRRGGAQRMPTEEEIAAIARANPELAQRIREAIRQRQAQDQQQGAKP